MCSIVFGHWFFRNPLVPFTFSSPLTPTVHRFVWLMVSYRALFNFLQFFFFLVIPMACGSSQDRPVQASNPRHSNNQATAVTMLDLQPFWATRELSLHSLFFLFLQLDNFNWPSSNSWNPLRSTVEHLVTFSFWSLYFLVAEFVFGSFCLIYIFLKIVFIW